MRFDQPVVCRNCLENIREKYLSISKCYLKKSVRFNHFLAASEYFSDLDCFDHDIALKFRPCGGLIGIENSPLDKYLKYQKFLFLHAILHDSGGFIYEVYNQRPGFSYMLPWKISNCFSGNSPGIFFCLQVMIFHPSICHLLEC